jgi:glycosyltransferase involved in cell wall biosynthesis
MQFDRRPKIALVSRAFWPFLAGGGMARYTRALATVVSDCADVTVLLPDFYVGKIPLDDPRLPRGVRFEFVPEPDRADPRPFASLYHAWSAAAYDALRELYPDGGPDLVEFNEFTGEGAVAVQAKRSGLPSLERTRIVVGVHGTDEIHRVLNGQSLTEPEPAALTACERVALAGADVVFVPPGDVQRAYERYYGADGLGPCREVTHPFLPVDADPHPSPDGEGPLRLIHVGRYERRKGVSELICAVRSLDRDDVRLTLVGRDTPTGPGGTSMLAHCRRLAGGDRRIELRDEIDLAGVTRALAEHDVVVIPSRWDTNPNTAREALAVGRPLLATPTGGLVQAVEDGHNGWLAEGTDEAALARAIERLLDDRDEVERVTRSDALAESLSRSVRNEEARAAYLDELRQPRPAPQPPVPVSVHVLGPSGPERDATLDSVRRQTAQPAEATHAVAYLPAGAILAPAFLETCGRALAAAPDAAYVTTWADAEERWQARPLGNAVPLVAREDCGGAVLVVRARHAERAAARIGAWELGGAGAWLLARELRAEGEHGVVVPEELVAVRNVAGWVSTERRRAEVEAALARGRTRWAAEFAAA